MRFIFEINKEQDQAENECIGLLYISEQEIGIIEDFYRVARCCDFPLR